MSIAFEGHVNPWCEYCSKTAFRSLAHARQATKTIGNRIRAYRCEDVQSNWHITKAEYEPKLLNHHKRA